jgi:hypothetical protein
LQLPAVHLFILNLPNVNLRNVSVNPLESALADVYENKRFQVEQNPHLGGTRVWGPSFGCALHDRTKVVRRWRAGQL